MRRMWSYAVILALLLFCTGARAEDQPQSMPQQQDWIAAVSPGEGAEIVAKKPLIKADFAGRIIPGSLFVTLDSTDVTQLLTVTEKGFEYRPLSVLPSGLHTLSITASGADGSQLQKTVSFSSRHTASLEESSIDNDLSMVYESTLKKPEDVPSTPYSKFEGNLRSDTKMRNNGWQFTFNTNLRYLDQGLPVFPPQKKGIDAANWLLTASYSSGDVNLKAMFGDVQVNETAYTVMALARKGGVLNLDFGNYFLNAFSVKSEQVFGFRGIGISDNTDDHIVGVSGGARFIDRKVEFRTIYVSGGEQGNSFGISTLESGKKGDVLGLLLTTNLLENKLTTEFETDFSSFDPDSSDEFGSRSDKAYKLKANGFVGQYNYEAMYEYVGKYFEVAGNPAVQKDREGVSLRAGAGLGSHAINLMFSRYNDNVRGDELFPRIVNTQGSVDYAFNGIPNLPMGVNYQRSVQDSTREPEGSFPVALYMDTVTGRLNYMAGLFGLGVQASYSLLNDKTEANNDSRTITYTVTPSYNTPGISANANLMLNRAKSSFANFWTDTYTINLDLRTKFLNERASFDIAGTYNIVKADNGSVDSRNLNANFRLGYMIRELLKGFIKPTVAIRGTYMKNTDNVFPGADRDEFTIFLVLATSTPFSF